MSKVICDVCGTSYPETVTQCPICGCVRSADSKAVAGVDEETVKDNGTYTYVKGGRFSKSNVNKRNKARHTAPEAPVSETRQEKRERMTQKRNAQSNKGLVVAVLALLLAIVAVVIYIVLRFFAPFSGAESPINNSGIVNEEIPGNTGDVVEDVPCTSIVLSETQINFASADISILLSIHLILSLSLSLADDIPSKLWYTDADVTYRSDFLNWYEALPCFPFLMAASSQYLPLEYSLLPAAALLSRQHQQ